MPSDILRRAMEYQAAEDAKRAAATPPPPVEAPKYEFKPEVIPDISSDREKSESDLELDRILDGVGIIEAYARWCGKMVPKVVPGKTEGIYISCPTPGHTDRDPSAWVNTEKDLWTCGPCGMKGGDKYDIAAYHHGLPVPGYKEGALFHKLRRLMGEDLGYTFNERSGGGYEIVPPVVLPPQSASTQVPVAQPPQQASPATPAAPDGGATSAQPTLSLVPQIPPEQLIQPPVQVPQLPAQAGEEALSPEVLAPVVRSIDAEADAYDPELDSDAHIPTISWRQVLAGQEDTFLWQWCEATSHDYSPEEYHLFSGLLLLGLAAGRDVIMADGSRPVMANLSICYLGKTGSGKSTAQNYIAKAIMDVMPENDLGIIVEGARFVGEVASGEALIGEFQKVVTGSVTGHVPIKGYVEFSELAGLLAKGSTQGSTLKTKMMDFIDGKPFISNSSQTHGRKVAMNAFAAFSTSSQPRALRKLLDGQDNASGYLNRWIYVAGPMKERPSFFGGPQIDLRPAFNKLAAIAIAATRKSPTNPPRVMFVNPDATKAFNTFFAPINSMIMTADNDMIARLEIHYKKLMLCHALNRHSDTIEVQDVAFVERLHPYVLENFKLVGAEIGRNQHQDIVDRVYNYIIRKQDEIAASEIAAGRAAPDPRIGPSRSQMRKALKTKNITDKQVNDAVDILIRGDVVEEFQVKHNGPGRPTKRVRTVKHD